MWTAKTASEELLRLPEQTVSLPGSDLLEYGEVRAERSPLEMGQAKPNQLALAACRSESKLLDHADLD